MLAIWIPAFGVRRGLILFAVSVLLLAVLVALLLPVAWKRRVLRIFAAGWHWQSAVPGDYALLDTGTLDAFTSELLSLGFVMEGDFVTAYKADTSRNFIRLMVHPQYQCSAQIMQTRRPNSQPNTAAPHRAGSKASMYCSILSRLAESANAGAIIEELTRDAAEPTSAVLPPLPDPRAEIASEDLANRGLPAGYWHLTTANQRMNGVQYMLRHPRLLLHYTPGLTPAELLRQHLERRERLVANRNLVLLLGLALPLRMALARRHIAEMRRLLIRKNPWEGFYEALFVAPKVTIWDGDATRLN
jgi:hypothetical protein